MRVQLHWRPSHVEPAALRRLHETLLAHPGPDEVRVVLNRATVRLPVTVDAHAERLTAELHAATGATVLLVDETVETL